LAVYKVPALGLLAAIVFSQSPAYDLLLKGGHVIDPANKIGRVMDVAVKGDKIERIAPEIPTAQAAKTIDLGGLYVTPGLIDLHAHVYVHGHGGSLFPDSTALVTGATTVVDCGSSGWRTFEHFKANIIDRCKTRVLAFLNIVGWGMTKGAEAENNVEEMDPAATAAKIKQYPNIIVGIKTAHFMHPGWIAIQRTVEAGKLSGKPVIVDDKIYSNAARTTREKLLEVLRPGDLHTHIYNDRQLEVLDRFTGKVQPYMWEARKRGVLFDLGHGAGSFLWPVATRAMEQGFPPDTLSTDLHAVSIMVPQSDMANCISKFINLGMELQDAIRRSTVTPARIVKRFPELGTLGQGRVAEQPVSSPSRTPGGRG
jgi:dihydroorotase